MIATLAIICLKAEFAEEPLALPPLPAPQSVREASAPWKASACTPCGAHHGMRRRSPSQGVPGAQPAGMDGGRRGPCTGDPGHGSRTQEVGLGQQEGRTARLEPGLPGWPVLLSKNVQVAPALQQGRPLRPRCSFPRSQVCSLGLKGLGTTPAWLAIFIARNKCKQVFAPQPQLSQPLARPGSVLSPVVWD